MADEGREPGILEVLEHLFSDPGFKCPTCNCEDAFVLLRCACGFKIEACLPCAISQERGVTVAVVGHMNECEKLRHLVKISGAANE